jgi:type IV secretory pathway VirB10-like protein
VDLGNIVYIVAVLAYFIYQATKNKKKNQGADPDQMSDVPEQKPASFEDLMREIRDAQKPKPVAPAKPKMQPAPVAQPKEVVYERAGEIESRPEWRADPAPAVKRFPTKKWEEGDDDEIQYYQGAFEKVKSDLTRTSKGIPEIPSFKEVAEETSYTSKSRYARMLKNPQSIRDAVVLKEILDRKNF